MAHQGKRERGSGGLRAAVAAALFWWSAAVAAAAVCEGPPARAGADGFGPDYLPRLELSDPSGPGGQCALALPDRVPGPVVFALRASNLLDGATGARLRLIASEPITGFASAPGLSAMTVPGDVGTGVWTLDVLVSGAPFCGPASLGELTLAVRSGCRGLWADLTGFGGDGPPIVVLRMGETPALCPNHGAYAGPRDLYHCQLPLCPEPNEPVRDFTPLASEGRVPQLGWTAGGGNVTVIRYRSDGFYPISLTDGELLAAMPTIPGQRYTCRHENPEVPRCWYSAFAVTVEGETIVLGSRLECGALTTASFDPSIEVMPATWGALKRFYR
jgi:hypothetical protein